MLYSSTTSSGVDEERRSSGKGQSEGENKDRIEKKEKQKCYGVCDERWEERDWLVARRGGISPMRRYSAISAYPKGTHRRGSAVLAGGSCRRGIKCLKAKESWSLYLYHSTWDTSGRLWHQIRALILLLFQWQHERNLHYPSDWWRSTLTTGNYIRFGPGIGGTIAEMVRSTQIERLDGEGGLEF